MLYDGCLSDNVVAAVIRLWTRLPVGMVKVVFSVDGIRMAWELVGSGQFQALGALPPGWYPSVPVE
jgi:hypothetical protein